MTKFLGLRHAAIAVTDIKRAAAFYRHWFGFTDYHVKDQDWVMLSLNGTTLSLIKRTKSKEPLPLKTQQSHPEHFGITVENQAMVDEVFKNMQKECVVYPPKLHRDQSYGFYFQDSENNVVELIYIPETPMECC